MSADSLARCKTEAEKDARIYLQLLTPEPGLSRFFMPVRRAGPMLKAAATAQTPATVHARTYAHELSIEDSGRSCRLLATGGR